MRCVLPFVAGLPGLCQPVTGVEPTYGYCLTHDDCVAADLCITVSEAGGGICLGLCRTATDCASGEVCYDLDWPRYTGEQAWGVCAPAEGEAPAGWTCDPAFWADGQCDCGCGLIDPDCADPSVDSCEYCDDLGSCSEEEVGCPGLISATNNAVCAAG